MIHDETNLVTESNGPRPLGNPNQCFYCQMLMGLDHHPDCVCRKRTVVVRAQVEYVVDVPQDWAESMIEFHRNDSSWCAGNMIAELEEVRGHNCLCNAISFTFIREATAEDEMRWFGEGGYVDADARPETPRPRPDKDVLIGLHELARNLEGEGRNTVRTAIEEIKRLRRSS